jgi:hypothetical protein
MKNFTLFYFGFVVCCSLLLIFGVNHATSVGNLMVMPLMGFCYFKFRIKDFIYSDRLMILVVVFGFISDLPMMIKLEGTIAFIEVLLTSMIMMLYGLIFRKEGSFLRSFKKVDYLKFIWILTTIFTFIIYIVYSSGLLIVLSGGVIYALVFSTVIILAFLRKVNKWSYIIALLGLTIKFIGDMMFAYLLMTDKIIYKLLNYIFYSSSQYFLINSFILNQRYEKIKERLKTKKIDIRIILKEFKKNEI